MKKVEGKRVVLITTIDVGMYKGQHVTKKKVKREEVTEVRFERLKKKYPLADDIPAGYEEGASIKDLGQCYETTTGGIRKIFGQVELDELNSKDNKPAKRNTKSEKKVEPPVKPEVNAGQDDEKQGA